ncbi:hypothetical protein [Nocardia testacea]|uniref:hypothetical protein n=1 Tax=Nocardia testacea TaxID=248551 RepID=UPI0033E200C1
MPDSRSAIFHRTLRRDKPPDRTAATFVPASDDNTALGKLPLIPGDPSNRALPATLKVRDIDF